MKMLLISLSRMTLLVKPTIYKRHKIKGGLPRHFARPAPCERIISRFGIMIPSGRVLRIGALAKRSHVEPARTFIVDDGKTLTS